MKESELNEEIFSRYGAVTRARGCFLYTKKGVRLTDMYQAGGRAILGWGGGDAFTRFKNILNRGITGSFITEYRMQIDRAVSELLSLPTMENQVLSATEKNECKIVNRKILFYSDKQTALKSSLCFSPENTSVWIPWRTSKKNDKTNDEIGTQSEYQGASENNAQSECQKAGEGVNKSAVVLVPPLPWTDTIYLVAVEKSLYDEKIADEMFSLKIPAETVFPSPLVAAITRSVYDLISAIKTREEKNWFIYDTVLTKYFERKGPYLYPKMSEEKYDCFVRHCLDVEIVISPFYNMPSIVPFGADRGVFTKLKKSEFSIYNTK